MVELKEIKRSENHIECKVYIEDCKVPVILRYRIKEDRLDEYTLPEEYSWCETHMGYAKRYIKSVKDEENLPDTKLIMWY